MKPAHRGVAASRWTATAYAFHELESLLACVNATLRLLIDDLAATTAMDRADVNRTLDVVLTIDTVLDVLAERLAERREAIEALYQGRLEPEDVAFVTRPVPGRDRGRRS